MKAFLVLWLAFTNGLMLIVAFNAPPNTRAVLWMGVSLVVVWVVIGGALMWRWRNAVHTWIQALPGDWRVKFVLTATCAALIEEAITTSLTNLAPLFGVPVGAAYITASANYLDVVCLHSVVVFIPMFIGWAFLLSRYAFHPDEVFLLFGLTGVIGEVMFGGLQALQQGAFWIFVYGLMIYLPAYSLPQNRPVPRPRWWHYGLAVLLPILFSIPVALLISSIHPVRIHFSDIPPNS